ncbi:uncharacterized protein LOC125536035 [Triticum urartu]|uniref:uncharacterized protein LOC125536035 n=1 Tax=Triticum urartu TaxID=4572 RepID=UPI002044A208|nr:uncharacterized protein LOC125536035 [Triticum urartu]
MVFLQRSNPRKRPPPAPTAPGPPPPPPPLATSSVPTPAEPSAVDAAAALLADAGCTLLVPPHLPPSLPSAPTFVPRLTRALAADPAADLPARLLAGLAAFAESPTRLRQLLLPTSPRSQSLARVLLSVPALQPGLLGLLLDKLPEHFDDDALDGVPLQDDVGRLIVAQFRWLDFLVDADTFVTKLMEVLSVAPPRLKKEIIGSIPEIVGDQSHAAVVSALEKLLQEDCQVVVAVLDTLSNLNLDALLQEQAVTVAISCIRTIHADQMPHLLRFLLLSATPANVGRIISQIREQLKFVGVVDPRAARSKKLKGKASATSTDGAILDALRSGLRFKNMLCEAFLKELKLVDHARDHKVIDVWLIMLIYANGGALQKSAEKILKSKILQGYIRETLFHQCIHGNTELVKDHFMSYLSVSDYLLACKEDKAREFATYLFTALFEEFSDTFSRQEKVLPSPNAAGRIAEWNIEVQSFQLELSTTRVIKGATLTDFVTEWIDTPDRGMGEDRSLALKDEAPDGWVVYFDGAFARQGAGAGAVLISPIPGKLFYVVQLCFQHGEKVSNNITEYEGLIAGLKAATALGHVPRGTNKEVEDIAKRVSRCEPQKPGVFEERLFKPSAAPPAADQALLREEPPRAPSSGAPACGPTLGARPPLALEPQEGCWTEEFKAYLLRGALLEKEEDAEQVARQATAYCLQDGEIYRRRPNDVLLWCTSKEQGRKLLADIHDGDCGHHSSSRTLVVKAFRSGFYWPTTLIDATEVV